MKIRKFIPLINREAIVWIAALIGLAVFTDPEIQHITLCPLASLGFEHCPGCGLGRSIAYLFQGDIIHSIKMHPLGIVAVIMLLFRIASLTRYSYQQLKDQKT